MIISTIFDDFPLNFMIKSPVKLEKQREREIEGKEKPHTLSTLMFRCGLDFGVRALDCGVLGAWKG